MLYSANTISYKEMIWVSRNTFKVISCFARSVLYFTEYIFP